MRLVRFFIILVAVAAIGGGFGALVGGLFGFSLPRGLQISGRVEPGAPAEGDRAGGTRPAAGGTVGVTVSPEADSTPAAKGAAFGASVGIALGAFLGLVLALVDQFFLQITEWYARRRPEPAS